MRYPFYNYNANNNGLLFFQSSHIIYYPFTNYYIELIDI